MGAAVCAGVGAGVLEDFGASLLKLYVPDKDGKTQDIVLGYETLEDYENGGDSLGATVGRVANRIGMAEFELNGKKYEKQFFKETCCRIFGSCYGIFHGCMRKR